MSDTIKKHRELSKKALIPGEAKSSGQRTPAQTQRGMTHLMYLFFLCAIIVFFILVTIWIIDGFSKVAIMLPFIMGFLGVTMEMIRRKCFE